jgi:hypothetical protein
MCVCVGGDAFVALTTRVSFCLLRSSAADVLVPASTLNPTPAGTHTHAPRWRCRDHFCQQLDNSSSGIKATIGKLMQLLQAHDPQLAEHLHKNKVGGVCMCGRACRACVPRPRHAWCCAACVQTPQARLCGWQFAAALF